MRVVYLHQYFVTPDMVGGSRSYEMARRMVAAGHEVHVVTGDQSADSRSNVWRKSIEAGIHVHWTAVSYDNSMSYGRRIFAFLRFAWRAAGMSAKLNGDVIFATSTPLTIAIPAVYASRRCNIPMVFEVRDLWPAVPIAIGAIKNPLLKLAARWLERFAYKNSERVVALAPGMRDEIVATGYPAARVSVIPNGCDLDIFSATSDSSSLREQHHWLGDRKLVVFTGTFGLVNGMEYLVKLAVAMMKLDSEIRIVALGTGRDFQKTWNFALETGVLDKNLYLLGQKPKKEAANWVTAADLTLALFTGPEIVWRDAVQNKFFDSLAAATPIASNFRGWQSIVAEEAGAGLIISPNDLDSAAADLVNVLGDRHWLENAGSAAINLARETFDRNLLATRLIQLLESVHNEAAKRG